MRDDRKFCKGDYKLFDLRKGVLGAFTIMRQVSLYLRSIATLAGRSKGHDRDRLRSATGASRSQADKASRCHGGATVVTDADVRHLTNGSQTPSIATSVARTKLQRAASRTKRSVGLPTSIGNVTSSPVAAYLICHLSNLWLHFPRARVIQLKHCECFLKR